jgi:hypothetical protein
LLFIVVKLIRRHRKKKEILRNLAMECTPESTDEEEAGGFR